MSQTVNDIELKDETRRVTIRMGHSVYDWFYEQAKELGVPTTSLMIMAMNEYRKQQTAVTDLPKVMNDLQGMNINFRDFQK